MNDDAPEWLTDEARAVWDQLPDLDVDRDAVAVYCCAVADFTRAQRALDQTGVVIRGPSGRMVRSPLNSIKQENAAVVRTLARQLGLLGTTAPPPDAPRTWRNQAAAERTIAALRATGRLEPVDAATAALVRHIAAALDQVDPARWPAQTASLARSQLAALRLLRGERDSDTDDSLDALAAALSAPLGDAPES